jgi:hypothetical protein
VSALVDGESRFRRRGGWFSIDMTGSRVERTRTSARPHDFGRQIRNRVLYAAVKTRLADMKQTAHDIEPHSPAQARLAGRSAQP